MKNNFKIGDPVYCDNYGTGKVITVGKKKEYPKDLVILEGV